MLSSLRAGMGKRAGIFAAAMAMHAAASAGSLEGPYVAWVNLANDPRPVDARVKDYIDSGRASNDCWRNGSVLYMRRKPAALTKELVRQAVVDKEPKAMRALNKLLKQPFDERLDGMDGVIVYDDAKGPKVHGLTTGGKKVKTYNLPDPGQLEKGFCAVLPPISRTP